MGSPIGEHLLELEGQLRVSLPVGEQKVHPGILIPHRRGEEEGRREMCIFSLD